MAETPAFLIERLKAEGDKMIAFFGALNDEQWAMSVYTEGATWSVRNVLSHFVTSERGLVKLFETIRQGGPGAADDFSIDRYNAAQQEKTKDLSSQELLAQYQAIRAGTIEWVNTLTEADLQKTGRHPFLGPTTLAEMIKMLYMHNQLHLRDLRKALK
jgi:uncharacterized damage-inducible protein DinB